MQIQHTIRTTEPLETVRIQVLDYFKEHGYTLNSLNPNTLIFERSAVDPAAAAEEISAPPATTRVELSQEESYTWLQTSWLTLSEGQILVHEVPTFEQELNGLLEAVHGELLPEPSAGTTALPSASSMQKAQRELTRISLETQFRIGAAWFYWIAGLSVGDILLSGMEGDLNYIFGLGLTQMLEGMEVWFAGQFPQMETNMTQTLSLLLVLLLSGLFAGFGVGARQKKRGVYIAGMVLYLLDGMLLFILQDFLSAAFHMYALAGLFRGYHALREILSRQDQPSPQD